MDKIFVTGATGFIGGNIVEKLLAKGCQVKALARNRKKLELYKWKDKAEIIWGDILEPETFEDKISDCKIIIHCAATITWWNRLWDKVYQINVIGTRNVLNAAIKSHCEKFVHMSSIAAVGYSENGELVNEEYPYNWGKHKIVYMETKHQAEEEVKNAIKKGLNATIVNPANVWGVNDFRGRRASVIKAVQYGFPFYMDGGTNFVDVDAVSEATINAIKSGKCGERYILGGDNLSIKDFLNVIADEVNGRRPFLKLPVLPIALLAYTQEALGLVTKIPPKPTASQLSLFGKKSYYDNSKAIKELKMPQIPFKECIHKTVNFYKEQNLL